MGGGGEKRELRREKGLRRVGSWREGEGGWGWGERMGVYAGCGGFEQIDPFLT